MRKRLLSLLKPWLAFVIINISVIIWIFIILYLLSIITWIDFFAQGSGIYTLLLWSAMMWFLVAIISLFISKWVLKELYRIQIVDERNLHKFWPKVQYLYYKLKQLASSNNIDNIEFGIYPSAEPNAFAAWCGMCGRLIAFSTGILDIMDEKQLDWVLWHEFAHIMNHDVVTTTMLQGFLNTAVIFLSRLIASVVSRWDEDNYFAYFTTSIILELLFGVLAGLVLAWYSRMREYDADKDSALFYSNKYNMASALETLKQVMERWVPVDPNNDMVATLKINNFGGKLLNLFSTHPPLEERIKRVLSL